MDISSMLEVQMKVETDVKENVTPGKDQTPSTASATDPISQEESNFYKLMFGNDIASVRFRRIHCTACDAHIGSAPAQIHNMFEHPVLRTLLCSNCRDFYGDGSFEQGDDATDMFCRWCANGGNLYCCSYCSNTFCYKCIRRNFTSLVRKKIEADEKWKCFVCNPSDLYNARALCWALLQHVQTVTRILKNDKKMSAQDIEDKMNLDESPCCPRRNKRKRRRLESNSEEEDETYTPKANGLQVHIRRKQFKQLPKKPKPSYTTSNGTVTRPELSYSTVPIPIRPRPASFLSGQTFNQIEQPQPLIERKNSIKPSDGIVLSSPSIINSNTSSSRYDSNVLQQQPPLYHTTFMNTAGSSTYIQASTINPTSHQIIIPTPPLQPTSYQPPSQSISYQPPPQPMVSIPNSSDSRGRPRFLLPKPRDLDITLTPNIIELDSDSDDELTIVEQPTESMVTNTPEVDVVDISSEKVVPVALTWENSEDDDVREEQPLREMSSTLKSDAISFGETMLPHSRELDKVLSDMKLQVYSFFDMKDAIQDVELAAEQKLKLFYRNMRDTILQLAHINDRTVREYNGWRRSREMETETETQSSTNENALASQENVEIPLDMTCVNDSDTESDCEKSEYRIKEPSNFVKNNKILEDLFFKKDVVHRSVGDDSVHLSVDKAIQVYDVVSRDYEKCISYSMLTRADQNTQEDNSILKSLTAPDKKFGKYEEQFIFYLQHIEDRDDRSIEMEDTNSLIESNKTPFQELVDANSPFISDLLQNINSPVVSTDQLENCEQEASSKDHVNSMAKDDETNETSISTTDKDENKKMDSDCDTRIQETNMQLDELEKTGLQETHKDMMDVETISIVSNNDDASSSKNGSDAINVEAAASTESKDTASDD